MIGQRLLIALQPPAINVQILASAGNGDAPMARFDKIGGGVIGYAKIVNHHVVHAVVFKTANDLRYGESAVMQFAKMGTVIPGRGYNDTIHPLAAQTHQIAFFGFHIIVRVTQQHGVVILARYVFHAARHQRPNLVFNARHHQRDDVGFALAQRASKRIGLIVERLNGFHHARFGGIIHKCLAAKHA